MPRREDAAHVAWIAICLSVGALVGPALLWWAYSWTIGVIFFFADAVTDRDACRQSLAALAIGAPLFVVGSAVLLWVASARPVTSRHARASTALAVFASPLVVFHHSIWGFDLLPMALFCVPTFAFAMAYVTAVRRNSSLERRTPATRRRLAALSLVVLICSVIAIWFGHDDEGACKATDMILPLGG